MITKPKILGQLLVEAAGIGEAELNAALQEQERTGARIGQVLVQRGATDEETVARCLSSQLNLPYVAPPLSAQGDAISLVPQDFARQRTILPLTASPRSIRLAMADPLDVAAADDLRFRSGRRVEPVVASRSAVHDGLDQAYGAEVESILDELPDELTRDPGADPHALEAAARAVPVVRLVDRIFQKAVEQSASDIHIEPTSQHIQVRYRIDGVLRRVLELPLASASALVSRIKVMARMDISVKRRPQDGGIVLQREGGTSVLRVSTLPIGEREKAVVRILDPERVPRGLDALGLSQRDVRLLREFLTAGHGVILAAGPTGSGKSTTLFAALAELDREGLNIVTLEDPVEYRVPGVNQVQMDPRAGLTFPTALRSVLRQDPDAVMIGEIRDRETAEIAMAAAITGHLVLSTIHTIDAPGAITRLLNMGVPPFLVAGGLAGVVAQRLVRRICPSCKGESSEGCSRCPDGYSGRTGVFQILVMTDAMNEEVVRGASISEIRRLASEAGMGSLAEDARRKVAERVTTPHEVGRVLQAAPGTSLPCGRCGKGVPHGALGCPSCGKARTRLCVCGKELGPLWRYCAWCLRKV